MAGVNVGYPKAMRNDSRLTDRRFIYALILFGIIGFVFVLRLAKFQILDRELYAVLASDQHDMQYKIQPSRGRILIRDQQDGKDYPLASNRDAWNIYAVPRNMKDPVMVAHELAPILGIPDVDLVTKLTNKPDDPFESLAKDVPTETLKTLQDKNFEGVGFTQLTARLYPEKGMGGQEVGVVTADTQGILVGRYGIESSYQDVLAGHSGTLEAEKDARGRRLIFANTLLHEAVDGSDVVLTLDRSIQYQACDRIRQGVENYDADSGTIIIMDPQTGAILAMCSWPDFEPSNLKDVKDVSVFNNPAVFTPYEPGSVFKAITMAAGIDNNKVGPRTTYDDKGVEEIDDFKIKNSDLKAHGTTTMTQVLELSLNTGAIFVERLLGKPTFRSYVSHFGFGKKTGVELKPESAGDISPLDNKGDVFAATASFGQGITATPIQLISAYGALANRGRQMRPYLVDEVRHPDGKVDKTTPQMIAQPVGSRAAQLITGMLVSVVDNGHSKLAGVPGYYIAGKTGTAQVAKQHGVGYEAGRIIATFIGYAPANDPKFVMLVKFDNPRKVAWAETCAAPVFGDLAKYMFQYFNLKPEREVKTSP